MTADPASVDAIWRADPPPLSTSLPAAVDAVLDALHDAGIQASTTLAELDPPGLLVTVPALQFRFGRCHKASFTLWAIVPGLDRPVALGQLAALLEAAATALDSPWQYADSDTIGPPTGGILPAYRVEFTRRLT